MVSTYSIPISYRPYFLRYFLWNRVTNDEKDHLMVCTHNTREGIGPLPALIKGIWGMGMED